MEFFSGDLKHIKTSWIFPEEILKLYIFFKKILNSNTMNCDCGFISHITISYLSK